MNQINETESEANDNTNNKNPKSFVYSPLRIACSKGNDTLVQYLIEQGAEINVFDQDEHCPLSTACYEGNINNAQLLLTKDANINLRNKMEPVLSI